MTSAKAIATASTPGELCKAAVSCVANVVESDKRGFSCVWYSWCEHRNLNRCPDRFFVCVGLTVWATEFEPSMNKETLVPRPHCDI
jgi:hypothetical protein